jgi:hypothetical protein
MRSGRRAVLSRAMTLPEAALPAVLLLVVTLLAVTLGAAPAQAHGAALPDSQYYRSTISAIQPAVAGLEIGIDRAGETITVTNHTGSTVTVPGYSGEEYLRITPSGVDENTNSLSAFLNGSLVIEGLPQQLGEAQKPPVWTHVADQPSFAWHDHRVHWMAQQRPPVVAADPTRPHTVFAWSLPLRVGQTPVTVTGVLTWVGAPAVTSLQLSIIILGVTLGVLLVGLLALRLRRSRRRPGSGPPSAAPASPQEHTPDPVDPVRAS